MRLSSCGRGKGYSPPGPSRPLGTHPRRVPAGARSRRGRRARRRALSRVRRARSLPSPPLPSRARALPGSAARAPRVAPHPRPSRRHPAPGRVPSPDPRESVAAILVAAAASSKALLRGGEGAASRARGPASRRRRRRLLLGSPELAAPRSSRPRALEPRELRELRSASRAPPCRSRPGLAMLRRPAPALAPAARLLLAGLLCGGGVWAARGKPRGRAGPLGRCRIRVPVRGLGSWCGSRAGCRDSSRDAGSRVRAQGAGSGRGVRVGGRARGAGAEAQETAGARCGRPGEARLGPGRGTWAWAAPTAARGGGCADLGGRADGPKGQSALLSGARRLGLHPWVRCCVYVCSEVHQAEGARTVLVCAYIRAHSSASRFQDPDSLLLHRGHHDFAPFRLLPGSFRRCLFPVEPRLKLSTSLPPFHPKVKSR